jgi:hypothetical protein
LYLNNNGLTGTIPSTFSQLRQLGELRLEGNRLTGTYQCPSSWPASVSPQVDCEEVSCDCCADCWWSGQAGGESSTTAEETDEWWWAVDGSVEEQQDEPSVRTLEPTESPEEQQFEPTVVTQEPTESPEEQQFEPTVDDDEVFDDDEAFDDDDEQR